MRSTVRVGRSGRTTAQMERTTHPTLMTRMRCERPGNADPMALTSLRMNPASMDASVRSRAIENFSTGNCMRNSPARRRYSTSITARSGVCDLCLAIWNHSVGCPARSVPNQNALFCVSSSMISSGVIKWGRFVSRHSVSSPTRAFASSRS
eukprot:Amastigsp_a184346_31.p2 type:complete len:151 gc:universal Amastigsp_a184346_31:627-1079(+)